MNVYFAPGTGKHQRLIYLNKIAQVLGSEISENLAAIHALTGCDSTSSFYGKGKKSTYNIISTCKEQLCDSIALLGESFYLNLQVLPAMERIICKIYKTTATNVSEARYRPFCTSGATEQTLSTPNSQ